MKTSSQHSDLTAELNFELYFVTEVLKLHSLHYGYWDDGRSDDRIDLENVRQARRDSRTDWSRSSRLRQKRSST